MAQQAVPGFEPEQIVSTENDYILLYKVGAASNSGATVFRAMSIPTYPEFVQDISPPVFVALKVIDINQREEYAKLARDIYRYRNLSHQNIVPIYKTLIFEDKFYAEMPCMMFSLESIVSWRHKLGLAEDCIAIALRETLTGLVYLHGQGLLHKDIHAGHIFIKHSHHQILLAFAGSIYEHNPIIDEYSLPLLSPSSSSSISTWAAAPEVVKFGENRYSCKGDIWLIGITALQLVNGGSIPVSNRQELDAMINILMKRSKIPTWDMGVNGRRKLSKHFWKMVKMCLAQDPEKRPTAEQLLKHKFFKKCGTVDHFYSVVVLPHRKRFFY